MYRWLCPAWVIQIGQLKPVLDGDLVLEVVPIDPKPSNNQADICQYGMVPIFQLSARTILSKLSPDNPQKRYVARCK